MHIPPVDIIDYDGGIFFISGDYHLLPNEEPEALLKLSQELKAGDHLLILGDLFEVWYESIFGIVSGYEQCLKILADCHQRNIHVHLIQGNRDFMTDKGFCKLSQSQLHKGPLVIRSNEESLLAIHGDELLPDDHGYQKFKAFSRHNLTLNILHSLPLFILKRICQKARNKSIEKVSSLNENQFKPDLRALRELIVSNQCKQVIAGHLHQDLNFSPNFDNLDRHCTVLPDSGADQISYRTWDGQSLSELKQLKA